MSLAEVKHYLDGFPPGINGFLVVAFWQPVKTEKHKIMWS